LIDFGFVGMVHNFSAYYNGTKNYADPNYLHNQKKMSYNYDTFGFGVVLYSFLLKDNFPDPSCLDITEYKKDFQIVLGNDYFFNIWKSMINDDYTKRISAEELYHSVKEFWEKYPLTEEKDTEEKEEIKIIDVDFNNRYIKPKMMGLLIDWIIDVLCNRKSFEIIGHTVKLVYRLLERVNVEIKEFQLIGASVMYLTSVINMHDDKVTPVKLAQMSKNSFDYKDIISKSLSICETLDWEIYPIGHLAESMLDKSLTSKQLKSLYLKDGNPSDYCLLSEEEKYGYLKSVGYSFVKNSEL
jgi:serine/threonine protein kinase